MQEERVRCDGVAPERVLLIGGWMPMPVLLIVGLEYRRTLSLSVGFQDSDIPAERVRGFLDGIVAQMPIERSDAAARMGRVLLPRSRKLTLSGTLVELQLQAKSGGFCCSPRERCLYLPPTRRLLSYPASAGASQG